MIPSQLSALFPEVCLLFGTIGTLLYALTQKAKPSVFHGITQLALFSALLSSLIHLHAQNHYVLMHGLFVVDSISLILKPMILFTSMCVFLYSEKTLKRLNIPQETFYILGLLSVIGMLCLTSSAHLISIFVSIELMSLPLYATVAMNRDNTLSVEAGFKYFMTGAVASLFILYGFSFLYGLTGHLNLSGIEQTIPSILNTHTQWQVLFAIILILSGIAFKFGVAPFHVWMPDVFEGAPTPATLLLSTAPKLATFAVLIRLLVMTLSPLAAQWQPILIVLSVISIAWGNLLALKQTNLKRLLAYSSIAHMGYMFLGLIALNKVGYDAALIYLVVYLITTLATLSAVMMLEDRSRDKLKTIDDLSGLSQKDPSMSLMILLCIFSLTGLPPIVGFMAKFNILMNIIHSHHVALSIYAILFSAIGAFYYIRIIRNMYFQSESKLKLSKPIGSLSYYALASNTVCILLFGLFPAVLLTWIHL
jgi:NADH-quinone oxidoreductase subunit N